MKESVSFDLRSIGRRMPRRRYQRGTLRSITRAHGARPARRLPRGQYWAMWYQYVTQPDGRERRRQREKIIDRKLAESNGIGVEYTGPLTKADAQRVLDLLIAADGDTHVRPDRQATLAVVGQEYLELAEPNWGPHMVRVAGALVRKHIMNGKLGQYRIADLSESDLQAWLNEFVNAGSSRSLLKLLILHTRAIFKFARKQKIIVENPTEDLRAKSKKKVCERYLRVDECQRLLSVLSGRDHLIVRLAVQLGLRPEELFALRREDVQGDQLRIDEALVNGKSSDVKTAASAAFVYIPPEIRFELTEWLGNHPGGPRDWIFQTAHGRPGFLNPNNYRERILQPAAIRAGIGVTDTGKRNSKGKPILRTDVDFRCLRRTCATLFGDRAKDPKSTQTQLGHADPTITLRHYQKSIPASVRAAADQLERDLDFRQSATPKSQID